MVDSDLTYDIIDNVPCGVIGCEGVAIERTHNPFCEGPFDPTVIDMCAEHLRDFWPCRGDIVRACGCGFPTGRTKGVCLSCENLAALIVE